jgi:succinyl-diaminopimelate desuccinylase
MKNTLHLQSRAEVLARIADAEPELVEISRRLIAIESENPPGRAYPACAAALCELLSERGFRPERIGCAEAPSVRAFHGVDGAALYFHGHYDVVPVSDRRQFSPEVRGGRLYGRGSADMKGGLAALIVAASAIREAGAELDGRIGLLFVPDEETGGARGSATLAEQGLLGEGALGMLSPEPTGGIVWNANRGALTVRITVRGKPAHVGLSYAGVNAFEGMLAVAERLRGLAAEVATRLTDYAIQPDQARRSILLLGGQSGSGDNFNVVPGSSWFTLDRRFNPEEDLAEEKRRLLATLDELRSEGIELEYEILQEAGAAGVAADTELGSALTRSVVEIEGAAPRFELCPGLLELRFYAAAGVPSYCYGAGRLEVSHGSDEHVEIAALRRCAAVYALTALDLLA